ncbi:MAG: heavy metal translocating P-type ATPase [Chloroflexi bacterium]|nr:MAG: heavy metal translocating P-type ATPase [Chloroflexota bacterium]
MTTDPTTTLELTITGMDCADCALTLEKGVANLEGVTGCKVNFAASKMQVSGDVKRAEITRRVVSLGYGVTEAGQRPVILTGRALWLDLLRRPRNLLTLTGMLLIGLALVAGWLRLPSSVEIGLFALGGLAGIYFPTRSGWAALRSGQGLDMNVLMCIAAVGAFAIGEHGEAATVIVLFSLGEALEGFTMERARDSIRSLTLLAPSEATVLHACEDCKEHVGRELDDGSGVYESGPPNIKGSEATACPWCSVHEQTVSVESLAVGDIILVKPGERIPMDGVVRAGRSAVNQAPITGESVPVEKSAGAEVFAGTINGDGALEIEVTRLAANNTIARLIHLVEEAQAQKTPTQRFVDRFARVYTPAVVVGAVLIASAPPLFFGQPLLDTAAGHGWLYRALAMLVIACPCALVIATPVTVVSAIAALARRGVLVKGGAHLEALGRVRAMAFDKTGTLTHGRPELTATGCADACCEDDRARDPLVACDDCDEMLALAAAIERRSSHPLARAVTRAADARGLPQFAAGEVESLPGRGVRGVSNGKRIVVGSHALTHEAGLQDINFCERVEAAEAKGQSVMVVSEDDVVRGYLAVNDPLRSNSRAALAALKQAGVAHTMMLTGDNATVANAVGKVLGVDEVRAGLLPQDKVDAVRALVAEYGQAAMVGDGVNDAPALAAASLGIAMGGAGTAQALETADVALMADDLAQLPVAIRVGRRAGNIIRFNIWFALLIKALFLAAALAGAATLWMAVFADVGASLLVTLNGMRLLRQREK